MRWPFDAERSDDLAMDDETGTHIHCVDWSQPVQCLVDEQTEFERDALRNAQPMQVVANQWHCVVILAATKDDTSGTVQDVLQFVCLLLSAGDLSDACCQPTGTRCSIIAPTCQIRRRSEC